MATTHDAPLAPPESTHWDINKILKEAQAGRLQVPDFQRNFRWKPEDILNLFDSLYKGYPVGNLLLWKTTPTNNTRATFGASSFDDKQPEKALLIIDGQQRITSLVGSLLAPPDGIEPIREFCVFFDLDEQLFKHPRTGETVPAHWLPMTEVADTVAFLEWLQDAGLTSDQVRRANLVVRSLRDYRLPAYLVAGGPEQEHLIREIFSRLNTMGRSLKQAEIFKALHGGGASDGLDGITDSLRAEGFGELGDRWLLKAVAATVGLSRDKELTRYFSKRGAAEKQETLRAAEGTLKAMIGFLRDDARVPDWSLLPYRFTIIALSAYFDKFKSVSPAARQTLRRWFWLGAYSGTHSRSDQPTMRAAIELAQDASDAESASQSLLDTLADADRDALELGAHNGRAAVTKVLGCVLVNQAPCDLETGEPISPRGLFDDDDPYVQVVRGSRLGTESRVMHPSPIGTPGRDRNTLVEWISQWVEVEAEAVLASHLISLEAATALVEGDDQTFLDLRAKALQDAAHDFLAKMTGVD